MQGDQQGNGFIYRARKSCASPERLQVTQNEKKVRVRAQNVPVQKNEQVIVDITSLTHNGEGVGYIDGFTLFIREALPGERVCALVLKVKKRYGYAKVLDWLMISPYRAKLAHPPHVYGGCQLQHLTYEKQLVWKRQHVVDVLTRIGKFHVKQVDKEEMIHLPAKQTTTYLAGDEMRAEKQLIKVRPTIGMVHPWRYRNKSQMPIGKNQNTGELIGGYFAQASHRIIDTDICLIQHEIIDDAMQIVKCVMRKYNIEPYHEQQHSGLLRHVIIRVGFRTNEMMLVFVTNGNKFPYATQIISELPDLLPQLISIGQSINTKRTNVIMGDQVNILWGEKYITDYIGDIAFNISASSFYQVNPVQTEVLYKQVLQYAHLQGEETVIDAYCGIGTISLFLAQRAKRVFGVEIVEAAIMDARRNAELNSVMNVEFVVGAAEDMIPVWKKKGIIPNVIVVDPPRKGCDDTLLYTMLELYPERIVYVSCNPSTLARDLNVLAKGGYMVVEIQPIDMFPQTVHVETVALLVRDNKGCSD